MEYFAGRLTGGEYYQQMFHGFLKRSYKDVFPDCIAERPKNLRGLFRNIRFALNIVREKRPDIIVVDIYSGCRNFLAVLWMKRNRKTVIVILQGMRLKYRYKITILKHLIRWCENSILQCADVIIANSTYLVRYGEKITSDKTKIVLARPGIRVNFKISPSIAFNIDNKSDSFDILYVGACNKVKGTIFAVEAISLLSDLDINLNIAGPFMESDAYFIIVKRTVIKENLQDKVRFLGFVEPDKMDALFRRSKLFIMPSLFEGYGIALAEAIAAGLPIVASDVGAIPELIEDGVNGILVPPGNSRALADAIRRLIENPQLRADMSEENLKRAVKLPTWDDFEEVLEKELVPAIEKLTGIKPLPKHGSI